MSGAAIRRTAGPDPEPAPAPAAAAAPQDETAWVRAACAGDRAAFGLLYDRHARMVHGILLARAGSAEVDDLLQDVFLQALRELTRLRDPAAFGPWLCAIARRRAADHHRRQRPLLALPEELAGNSAPGSEARLLVRLIAGLPEAYREPLMLRLCEGMTGPEIALRTGLRPASVRVNLHRGLRKLRERLLRIERKRHG
jgi:RNA polymerase sigma-70 factor (ECF subfamily)